MPNQMACNYVPFCCFRSQHYLGESETVNMRVISAILAAAATAAVQAGSWSVQIPNIGSAGVAISFTAPNTGFLPINDVRRPNHWVVGGRCSALNGIKSKSDCQLPHHFFGLQNGVGATVLKTGKLFCFCYARWLLPCGR